MRSAWVLGGLCWLLAVECKERAATGVAEAEAPEAPASALSSNAPEPPLASAVPTTASAPAPEPALPPASRAGPYPPFKKTSLPVEQVARMVADAPELGRLGGDIALFDPGDSPYLRRSKADRDGYTITPLPVLWSPEEGVQVLVVVGRGKEGSFVAAWWALADGQYRLASTFVMLGEVAPVALAYRSGERMLWWTTCWQCKGETGRVTLRDDHRVVIVQD